MAKPPPFIKGNKLQAFAKQKKDNPAAKLAKKPVDDDADKEPKDGAPATADGEGKSKGPDVEAAEQAAMGHEDDDIEVHMKDYDPEVDGNPPDFITDEATWNEAKKAAQPKWDTYDDPYAVVAYIYKSMGGAFKKKDE